ncbi:xanthine dehydrogenase accessory factor protein [Salinisphaera shabanensis E1L3A]|uniref:Xanthine dehydrogenase accessory factor protein n=1 Tax=Salinisphaera shabanensis E1L3A TaxID=1033802 RepID=U2FZV6_9GAMM|nr:XdhC/CoxI family protein [Salinisphaera shabanensis]ERJ19613.1 xanthine dehydrogenase accessory factor protein [Salinisphaera shabanensis E1L3A]
MSVPAFWPTVVERLAAGRAVFVALVVANTRGSPGTRGARLMRDDSGKTVGTIGGGIMERDLLERSRRTLADRGPVAVLQRRVHRKNAGDDASGLICAGEQTNLLLYLDPARDVAAIAAHAQAQAVDSPGTLLVQSCGVRFVDTLDGHEGLQQGHGADWCYREHSPAAQRLAIVGAGHCGLAVARLARDVGYDVTLFDHRAERITAIEGIRGEYVADYRDVAARLRHAPMTVVRVMTSSIRSDIAALGPLAAIGTRSLGVMGSRQKIQAIRTTLIEQGADADGVARIAGPIGLPIKSDTPAEIAVSVVGELLAHAKDTAGQSA